MNSFTGITCGAIGKGRLWETQCSDSEINSHSKPKSTPTMLNFPKDKRVFGFGSTIRRDTWRWEGWIQSSQKRVNQNAQITPHKPSHREDTWWWMGWVWQGEQAIMSEEHLVLIPGPLHRWVGGMRAGWICILYLYSIVFALWLWVNSGLVWRSRTVTSRILSTSHTAQAHSTFIHHPTVIKNGETVKLGVILTTAPHTNAQIYLHWGKQVETYLKIGMQLEMGLVYGGLYSSG